MNKSRVLLLLLLTCCHVIGILVFFKGFLLKRVIVPELSNCTHSDSSNPLPACTGHVRRYKRVVWLLVDALRYDFMLWDDSLPSPSPVYRNKMTFVQDLLKEHPTNAQLFKFIADPPTTTMQRLKALTTGGLPTFIDISSNFNSYEIIEDSLIHQVSKNGRNITFMGDDTWLGLYPSMLSKVYPYPSLNVKDIHTVDTGVLSQLFSELRLRDAELLIGHFLGVDHIGHTYGPSHWTMGDKLVQMDNMVRDVVEAVDNDTLVLVFGDHGMTSTGDHGGETELETHAALLVYSKQPLFRPQQASERSVYQVDLVPSVALLLGVPIPFSNLGMLIPELFQYATSDTHNLLTVLRINAEQISTYLTTYARYSGDFPKRVFDNLAIKLSRLKSLHSSSSEASPRELEAMVDGYKEYMRKVKEMCHQVWAKFDDLLIWSGIILVGLILLATPALAVSGGWLKRISLSFVLGLVTSVVLSNSTEEILTFTPYFGITFTLLSVLWTGRMFLIKLVFSLEPLSILALSLATIHALSLLSNSFVLYEGDMIAFFLQTLIFCLALKHLHYTALEDKLKGNLLHTLTPYVALSVCIRLSKPFYTCRDMQYQDGCQESTFTQPLSLAAETLGPLANVRLLLSCAVVVAMPLVIYRVLGGKMKHISSGVRNMVHYGLPVAGLCVGGHWYMQGLGSTADLSYWQHILLPWVVYVVCGVTLVMVVWQPVRSDVKSMESEPITALVLVVMVMSVWVPLAMLLNDGLALSAALLVLQAALSLHVLSRAGSSLVAAVFWSLLTAHSFFACGHSMTVTSLRFESAFTGIHGEITKYNLPLAGMLVGLNTLGSQILLSLGAPILLLALKKQTDGILRLILTLIAVQSIKLLVTMFAASLHRRHLMVWQVFTPRVLYEGAFQLTSDLSLVISVLVANRVEQLTKSRV